MALKHPYEDDDKKKKHPFDALPPVEDFEKTNSSISVIEPSVELPLEIDKTKPNLRDNAIENQLKNMQFPTTIFFRPNFDYRKTYHILNILEAEFIEIIKYKPPDAFWCNFALDLLEFMHNNYPNFRDRLQEITQVITKIPKADDKQQYIKEFLLDSFKEMLKK